MKHEHNTEHSHESKAECCDHKNSQNPLLNKIHKFYNDYKPLIIILLFSLIIPFATKQNNDYQIYMYHFMGYFFLFFSLFKFFDLKGFVEGFSTYDLISKRLSLYGYIYPFIEFFIGLSYISLSYLHIVNWVTFIVMLISGVGVLISVLKGEKFKCACLGTTLNVPLSTVSIIENFGMGGMSAYMLIVYYLK